MMIHLNTIILISNNYDFVFCNDQPLEISSQNWLNFIEENIFKTNLQCEIEK